MNIILDGYFDKNFGDDLMQLLLVKALDSEFYVGCEQREMKRHLVGLSNVHFCDTASPDARVYAIGTGFLYNGKRAVAEKLLNNITTKKNNHFKQAVINCSIEPPKSRISSLLTKNEIRKYQFISCRDSDSYSYFKKNCPYSEVRLHPDLVFAANDLVYPKTDEGLLGIYAVRRLYSNENFEYYRLLASACDRFVEKHSRGVLLFALDSGLENDISAALSIREMMQHKDYAQIIAYNNDPSYIFKNFARCERLIGSRFHGTIAAMLSGIPCFSVYDTKKLSLLCRDYGLSGCEKNKLSEKVLFDFLDSSQVPFNAAPEIISGAKSHITDLKAYLEGEHYV